jgi:hypothetical protein
LIGKDRSLLARDGIAGRPHRLIVDQPTSDRTKLLLPPDQELAALDAP